jgi:hypothetical protein
VSHNKQDSGVSVPTKKIEKRNALQFTRSKGGATFPSQHDKFLDILADSLFRQLDAKEQL